MFRYTHSTTVAASDVRILMGIDRDMLLSERGTGVVFVAREVTDKLVRWTMPVRATMVVPGKVSGRRRVAVSSRRR
jgi:hypothetical protein